MIQKFNGKQLDLIKEKFDAKIANDTVIRIKSELDEKKLLRRRYLYTTNYALLHSDTEVAPFLALTELYNVNIKLLDTINNSLTEKVKTSKIASISTLQVKRQNQKKFSLKLPQLLMTKQAVNW